MTEMRVHATCLAIDGSGVLLLGPPGSGKSDLALRLLDQPGLAHGDVMLSAQLVADDQVVLWRDDNGLWARSPRELAGKLEIRGLGIVALPCLPDARLVLSVEFSPASAISRMPELETETREFLGVRIPRIWIDPAEASAPARLRAALLELRGRQPAGTQG